MSVIGGEIILTLKLDTVQLRNKIARMFIAFMMVYKGHGSIIESDTKGDNSTGSKKSDVSGGSNRSLVKAAKSLMKSWMG